MMAKLDGAQIYLVGGAVRDVFLGRKVQDKDYVVVGADVEMMLAAGFRPVGKDFPVFLHPQTNDEYALARTERKVSVGYKGFTVHTSPQVTLEEDLIRRDLTINAMAQDEQGSLIDPFGGQADLNNKILRHISDAFVEDPVRVLRVARFSARFHEFSIAEETLNLMQKIVARGELQTVSAERLWQEIARGLMEYKPSRMFTVLRQCGALDVLMPELNRLWGVPQTALYHPEVDTGIHIMMAIDYAAEQNFSLAVRFATLVHDLGKGTTPVDLWPRHIGHDERGVALVKEVCCRLKVPNPCRKLAELTTRYHIKLHKVIEMNSETLLRFIINLDAIRQTQRFEEFLQACEADARGRLHKENCHLPEIQYIQQAVGELSQIAWAERVIGISDSEAIRHLVWQTQLNACTTFVKRSRGYVG